MFHKCFTEQGQAVRRSSSWGKCFTEIVSRRGFCARFAVFVPFRPFSIRSERSAVAFLACFAFGLRAFVRGFRFRAFKRRFLGRFLSSWANTRL